MTSQQILDEISALAKNYSTFESYRAAARERFSLDELFDALTLAGDIGLRRLYQEQGRHAAETVRMPRCSICGRELVVGGDGSLRCPDYHAKGKDPYDNSPRDGPLRDY